MKTFIATILLFALFFFGAYVNYSYIEKAICHYAEIIAPLSPEQEREENLNALRALSEAWEKDKAFIQITATHNEVEAVTDAIAQLFVCAQFSSAREFEKAKVLLENALEELWLSEDLSLKNIL